MAKLRYHHVGIPTDKEVIIEPNSPAKGVTVAFIVENGAPIEFLQFDGPESETWPHAD